MEERLQYQIDMDETDETLMSASIPRMSMLTLVENAVKHGISGQKDGGLIRITIGQRDKCLQIRVCNPGSLKQSNDHPGSLEHSNDNPGLLEQSNDHPGIGLQNLQERISMIYQAKATFELSVNKDGLVCAVLNFPLS